MEGDIKDSALTLGSLDQLYRRLKWTFWESSNILTIRLVDKWAMADVDHRLAGPFESHVELQIPQ
eukprot:4159902-Prymnesium_polylepis.1